MAVYRDAMRDYVGVYKRVRIGPGAWAVIKKLILWSIAILLLIAAFTGHGTGS